MADSVYISKNLNEEQQEFIKLLSAYEILYFKMEDIEELIHKKYKNLNEILENLVDKKMLVRIARGVYARPSFSDVKVLATFISKKSAVAYWSALHYHGLTDRFPTTLFIKTPGRKRDTTILGTRIKFVNVKKEKAIGMELEGYGDKSVPITNIEMTFIDCFDQLRYAGDFNDLISAFAQASLRNNKLIEYTSAYANVSLIKRLGFLAELFHPDKLKRFINYARKNINDRYDLMYAGGEQQGEFLKKWRLRLNLSREDIIGMAQTVY